MEQKRITELLERYIQNACTPDEERIIHAWLDQESNLDGYAYRPLDRGEYERKEQRIWRKLTNNLWGRAQPSFEKKTRRFYFMMLKVAAAIVILSGLVIQVNKYGNGVLWWNGTHYQTGYGEVKEISLPDGSLVTLNAMSALKVTKRYGQGARELFLIGEAYFKVKSDKSHPFIVYTSKLATQALGTEFNISAYPEGKKTTVSLLRGKVEVRKMLEVEPEPVEVILNPGEEAELEKGNILKREEFSGAERIGWKSDKLLVFRDADIKEVLQKLTRYYGVKFDYRALGMRDWKLTGEYKEQSLIDVMESLSFNYNIDYQIKGDRVILADKN